MKKILGNKYVQSAFRHALNAGSVYLASQGMPEAWIGVAVAAIWSQYNKYAN